MFRIGVDVLPVPCPFDDANAFSYSTRGGQDTCEEPPSRLDKCTDEHRMVFRFSACPDVRGSESGGESQESNSAQYVYLAQSIICAAGPLTHHVKIQKIYANISLVRMVIEV
jgi:hypothetical protein